MATEKSYMAIFVYVDGTDYFTAGPIGKKETVKKWILQKYKHDRQHKKPFPISYPYWFIVEQNKQNNNTIIDIKGGLRIVDYDASKYLRIADAPKKFQRFKGKQLKNALEYINKHQDPKAWIALLKSTEKAYKGNEKAISRFKELEKEWNKKLNRRNK
ncbi:MAG: hypothetical protein ACP5OE_09585 [Thermodesulfobium sp.]